MQCSYFNGYMCAMYGIVFCKEEDNELLKKSERFPSLVLQLMYDMFGIKNVSTTGWQDDTCHFG